SDVASQHAVRREHDVVTFHVDATWPLPRDAVVEDMHQRREPLGLAEPVEDERARYDDQRWARPPGRRTQAVEERQHLDGLPESHVVGETTAKSELPQKVKPAEAFALVLAQCADEARRGIDRR